MLLSETERPAGRLAHEFRGLTARPWCSGSSFLSVIVFLVQRGQRNVLGVILLHICDLLACVSTLLVLNFQVAGRQAGTGHGCDKGTGELTVPQGQ